MCVCLFKKKKIRRVERRKKGHLLEQSLCRKPGICVAFITLCCDASQSWRRHRALGSPRAGPAVFPGSTCRLHPEPRPESAPSLPPHFLPSPFPSPAKSGKTFRLIAPSATRIEGARGSSPISQRCACGAREKRRDRVRGFVRVINIC